MYFVYDHLVLYLDSCHLILNESKNDPVLASNRLNLNESSRGPVLSRL